MNTRYNLMSWWLYCYFVFGFDVRSMRCVLDTTWCHVGCTLYYLVFGFDVRLGRCPLYITWCHVGFTLITTCSPTNKSDVQYISQIYAVWHNDHGICKITSSVFYLLITPHLRSETMYTIWHRNYRMQRSSRVMLNYMLGGRFILGYELCSLLKTLLWLWNVEQ
jgi:hypothetical protein